MDGSDEFLELLTDDTTVDFDSILRILIDLKKIVEYVVVYD